MALCIKSCLFPSRLISWKLYLFFLNFHFSDAQRNMEGSIDVPDIWGLREVFLRSGFAARSDTERAYRFFPCATGTFVNSSDTSLTCKECPAGKLRYSVTNFRKRSMYMSMDMECECGDRCSGIVFHVHCLPIRKHISDACNWLFSTAIDKSVNLWTVAAICSNVSTTWAFL